MTRVVAEGFGAKRMTHGDRVRNAGIVVAGHDAGHRFELDRHLTAWRTYALQARLLPSPLPPSVAQLRPPQSRQPRARRRS